jgi:hypothetical protein
LILTLLYKSAFFFGAGGLAHGETEIMNYEEERQSKNPEEYCPNTAFCSVNPINHT